MPWFKVIISGEDQSEVREALDLAGIPSIGPRPRQPGDEPAAPPDDDVNAFVPSFAAAHAQGRVRDALKPTNRDYNIGPAEEQSGSDDH